MKHSALGYNFNVNPVSSRAADVTVHFAYTISATVVLPLEVLLVFMATVSLTFTVLAY